MKTTQMKKLFAALCLLSIVSIGFWACRKQDYQSKDVELMNLVNGIRKWYDTASIKKVNFQDVQMAILSTNNNTVESNLAIDKIEWDKAAINYDSAQKIGIKIPVSKNNITGEKITLATMNVNGTTNGCFVKLIPDSTWYASNKDSKTYENLNGFLKIYSIKGLFLGKVKIANGAIISNNVEGNSSKSSNGTITTLDENLGEVTVTGYKHNVYIFINIRGGQNTTTQGIVYDMQPDEAGGGNDPQSPTSTEDSLNSFSNKITDSLHPCLDSILERLKGIDSGKIAAIIKKFSGEAPNWNLHFDEKETDPSHNANTDPYAFNGQIGIHLNYNNLSSATELSAARTIIHESIHAYLAIYFANDPILSKAEYPIQFDTWFTKERNGLTINNTQHDLMISNFLGEISNALEQFGKSKGYNLPKQFYNDMSWGGLLDILKNFDPISELDKARIRNTVAAEELNSRQGWIDPVGNKSCN